MSDVEHDIDLVFYLRTRTAHREIASSLECDIELVASVYDWLPSPFVTNPQSAKRYREEQKRLLEVAALARKLSNKAGSLESSVLQRALELFEIDVEKLGKLSEHLEIMTNTKGEPPISRSYKGGKNWAAYDVARGVAQIYRELGRAITFGHIDGEPSTNFGRHVLAAFTAFSIKSDWREPARYAAFNTDTERFY